VDGRPQFLCFGLPPGRYGLDHRLEVIRGDDGDHPRYVAGVRSVDRHDAGVGMGTTEYRGVQHTWELKIVEKRTLAGEQAGILKPFYRLT
jgi:hypothetical protein